MIEAYPLHWPAGWKRAEEPEWSRFKTPSFGRARDDLMHELGLLGATDVILSTNIPLRNDGLPKARFRAPDDAGVAVYFKLDGHDQCIPCDKWHYIEDNLHAIELTVNALRGLERWGAKDMVSAAFRGFKALPESSETNHAAWYDVLEVEPTATAAEVKDAYKRLLHIHHPDKGGSDQAFINLQTAYNQGLEATR